MWNKLPTQTIQRIIEFVGSATIINNFNLYSCIPGLNKRVQGLEAETWFGRGNDGQIYFLYTNIVFDLHMSPKNKILKIFVKYANTITFQGVTCDIEDLLDMSAHLIHPSTELSMTVCEPIRFPVLLSQKTIRLNFNKIHYIMTELGTIPGYVAFGQLGNQLKHLVIEVPRHVDCKLIANHLPHLQKLTIICDTVVHLQYLTCMKQLKELTIQSRTVVATNVGQEDNYSIVRVTSNCPCTYYFNLFESMLNLKRLTVVAPLILCEKVRDLLISKKCQIINH